MHLLLYEIRKACAARAASVFLIVLLAANFVLTYYTSRPLPVEKAAREVYTDYLDDPESVTAYKEQLEADFFEHLRDEEFEPPRTYTQGADDVSVLNRVLSRAEYIASYRAETEKIASAAEKRARDLGYLGYSEESFYIKEQRELADAYLSVAGALDGEDEYAYGYDIYLGDSRVCIFIALYLVFAVSFIFRNDRVCGFGSIMRASKLGRLPSLCAKLGAAVIITVGAVFLFLSTSFLATGMANGGFSSPTAPIQLLPAFAKVPLETSILGFICIQTAFRMLAAIIFSLVCALVASSGLNYFFCFGISALFAAANYFVFAREYTGTAPALKYLNIAAAADGIELFAFLRNINIFGLPVPYTAVLAFICVCAAALLSALCAAAYCRGLSLGTKKARILVRKEKSLKKREARLCHLLPLWVYELKKNRTLPILLLSCLLLAAHGFYISAAIGDGMSYGEAAYYSYIAETEELSAEERDEYISAERVRLERTADSYVDICKKLEEDEISYDEYSAFLPEYYDAVSKLRVLGRVEEYSDYIALQSERLGEEIKPVYSTGYENFFATGESFFLFAAILALSVGIFAVEYRSGNCAQIIKTAKKGRRHTFFSKILPCFALGALLAVSARAIGLAVTASKYPLPDPGSPLCAVREFSSVLSNITVAEYIAFDLLVSALAGALTASVVCALSCLCKRTLTALGASALLLALPAVLLESPLVLLDITAPQILFCSSFSLGKDAMPLLLTAVLLLHILACTALTAAARKREW